MENKKDKKKKPVKKGKFLGDPVALISSNI